MALTEIALEDYSGGLNESTGPDQFRPGQASKIKGLVLNSENQLVSQPSVQRVGTGLTLGGTHPPFLAVEAVRYTSYVWLIALDQNGAIWITRAPDSNTTYNGTRSTVWTNLGLPNFVHRHFVKGVPANTITVSAGATNQNVHNRSALLVVDGGQADDHGATAYMIYEDNGDPTNIHLATISYSNPYPGYLDSNPDEGPTHDVLPFGRVGVVWNDRLLLGNIVYFADEGAPLGPSNGKAYEHAIIYSEAGLPTTYDPLSVLEPGSAETAVVDMIPINTGLVVITTIATDKDGLILLRGDLSDVMAQRTRYGSLHVEVLRSGIGAPNDARADYQHKYACLWPHQGTVCLVDHLGGVWHTDGSTVAQLDGPEIKGPSSTSQDDHCAAIDRYLFVSRAGRLLVMTALDAGNGSWTELVTPYPGQQVISMTNYGDCMYFIQNGEVFRYNFSQLTGDTGTERGLVDGTKVTLELGTPTLDARSGSTAGETYTKKTWLKAGIRLQNRSGVAANQGEVGTVTIFRGAVQDHNAPFITHTVNRLIGGDTHEVTAQNVIVRAGTGVSTQCSVLFTLSGDVQIENITVWASGGAPKR